MTQTQIEKFSEEEFSHLLAYGTPMSTITQSYYQEEYELDWISTLESTTYPGMTFGYLITH